jgi:hypothetical protein
VIWDGVNPHRSIATRQFVEEEAHWLTLIRLPAYAPRNLSTTLRHPSIEFSEYLLPVGPASRAG